MFVFLLSTDYWNKSSTLEYSLFAAFQNKIRHWLEYLCDIIFYWALPYRLVS